MTAPDDTSWLGTSADWSDQGGWSAGIPDSINSVALISTSGYYDVTIAAAEHYDINSVTISNYGATVLAFGTLATSRGIDLEDGTLVNAGSLGGTVTVGSGGVLIESGGSSQAFPDNVQLDGGLLAFQDADGGNVNVTIAAGRMVLADGAIRDAYTVNAEGDVTLVSTVTLDNAGTLAVDAANYGYLDLYTDGLINSGLITTGTAGLYIGTGSFTNTGSGIVQGGGGFVDLGEAFTNAGTISVSGGELQLGNAVDATAWTNTGIITATDAQVLIGGDQSLADLDALTLNGDTLELIGTLDNRGGSLGAAAAVLKGAVLAGGTILGGTLDATALALSVQSGVLDGVTVMDGLTLSSGLLTLLDGTQVYADSSSRLGTILVDGTAGYEPSLQIDTAAGATLSQPVEVLSGSALVEGGFTLTGELSASGSTATIGLFGGQDYESGQDQWLNLGTVAVSNGATLLLGGDETDADFGTLALSGATVILTGTLENAGHTLNGTSGPLVGATLGYGGTVIGGVLDAGALDLSFGSLSYEGGVLDGVTLINGLTMTGGAVTLAGGSTVYAGAGTAVGTITLAGSASPFPYLEIDAASGTLDQPIDVLAGEALLSGGFTLTGDLTADGPNATIALDPENGTSFVNHAVISVTNGATLLLGGDETMADLGSLALSGAVVVLDGTLQNTGHVLAGTSSALSGATLGYGGTIVGGTLDAAALGLSFGTLYGGGALADVAIINGLSIGSGEVTLLGTSAVYAGSVGSAPGSIVVATDASLTFGAGSNATIDNPITLDGGSLTIDTLTSTLAAGGQISGYGYIYGDAYGTAASTLLNLGTITALPGPYGTPLVLEVPSFVNNALITVAPSAALSIGLQSSLDSFTNAGTILAENALQLSIEGGFTNTGLIVFSGGEFGIGYYDYASYDGDSFDNLGTISVSNATIDLGGSESLAALGDFVLNQSMLTLVGTLDASGAVLDGTGASSLLAGATLQSGTITGGTLDEAALGLSFDNGVLNDMAVIDGLTLTQGQVTLTGGTEVFADDGATLGTIVIDGPYYFDAGLAIVAGGPETIDQPLLLLDGQALLQGPFTLASAITASGASAHLTLGGASYETDTNQAEWVNLSTIIASSGASVLLFGDETAADIGTILNDGATLLLAGTLENAGGTLNGADLSLLGVTLANGTIAGGTLDAAALGLNFGDAAVLDDVTVIHGLTVTAGDVTLQNGSTVFAGAGGAAGTISVDASIYNEATLVIMAAAGATLAQPVEVTAGEAILEGGFTLETGITASGAEAVIALTGGPNIYGSQASWINLATIAANSGASVLLLGDETAADLGDLHNNGGTIVLAGGTYENGGSLLGALSNVLHGAVLDGGTIEGGTLDQAGLGLTIGNAYYSGFSNESDLDNVLIEGGLTIGGYVAITGTTALVAGPGPDGAPVLTITSGGEALFEGPANTTLQDQAELAGGSLDFTAADYQASTVTIAGTVTVGGYGDLSGQLLVNDGVIAADATGQSLYLSPTSLVNAGTVVAENGGQLVVEPGYETLGGGLFEVLSGSGMNFGYGATIAAPLAVMGLNAVVSDDYGEGLTAEGPITLGGGTLALDTLSLTAAGTLSGNGLITGYYGTGSFIDSGQLVASGGALVLDTTLAGGGILSVAGDGTLELSTYASNDVDLLASGAVLQLDQGGSLYSGTIVNFGGADQLVINGLAATEVVFGDGLLTIGSGTAALTLHVAGNFVSNAFTATSTSIDQTVIGVAIPAEQVTLAAPATLFGNPGIVTLVSGLAVTDPADATMTVQLSDVYGVLDATPAAGALVEGGGTGTLVLSGSIGAVNAELATLEYRPPAVGQPTDTIAVFATAASGETSALIAVDVNQPPSFALPASELLQLDQPGALAGVSLEKSDAHAGEIFTITLADPGAIITGTAHGTGSLSGDGGTLVVLTGTLADINAELAAISLTGTADSALTLTAQDGLGGTDIAYLNVDVNIPPVINAPASFPAQDGTAASGLGISLTDAYAASAGETLHVTLRTAGGLLAASGSGVAGNDSTALTLSGTLAQINADLASLTFTGTQAGPSDVPLTITAIDALGGAETVTIEAAIADEAPVFTLPAAELLQSGTPGSLAGVSLGKTHPAGDELYTVVLLDPGATITATAVGAGTVIGSGGTIVTMTGAIGTINTELAGVRLNGSLDSLLTLSAADGLGGGTIATLAVDVNVPATIHAPAQFVAADGSPVSVAGVSLSDAFAQSTGETLSVTLGDTTGTLAVAAGATVSGNGTALLTLTGTTGQIDSSLAGLSYTGATQGWASDAISITAVDAFGGTALSSIAVIAPAPPVLTVPSGVVVGVGIESPLDGFVVQSGTNQPAGAPITLSLTDDVGTLAVKIFDGLTVTGNDSTSLTLIGDAAALDTALSSLVYTGGTASASGGGIDSIEVTAVQNGASASQVVGVEPPTSSGNFFNSQAMPVAELLGADTGSVLQWDQGGDAYVGTLYVDPIAWYPNIESSEPPVVISGQAYNPNSVGYASVDGEVEPYAPLIGSWSSTITPISDLLPFSASDGDVLVAEDYNQQQPDTITYIFRSQGGTNDSELPDVRITVVFNVPEPPDVETEPPEPPEPEPEPPEPPIPPKPPGNGDGDVHLTTFDGLHYDFQAAGEFILAKSTVPGDSFQVQIRLQPWHNSATVSVTTALGAAVGADRVTFDVTRADTVWVDGQAVALSQGTPYALNGGTLTMLSSNSWEIDWNTGETLQVTSSDGYLNYTVGLASNAAPDSVEGLLGNDNGNPANDLALPDGTVLQQPLSYATLYTTFANAWRITQAGSLLDYGAGQSTSTYTDLSFPSDNVALSSIPAAVYQNALNLVVAAGITDPAAQQNAVTDYLLTGDPSFIAAAAETSLGSSSLLAPPVNPNPIIAYGIAADAANVAQSASGTTAVTFTIYATGSSASATILDYQVNAPDAGFLGGANFAGGTLPSGQITLAAGETATSLTLDVIGSLGGLPEAELEVGLSAAGSIAIASPLAITDITSATPEPGTAAVPGFLSTGGTGTLSGSGTSYVFDLGTFAQGTVPSLIPLDIVNNGGPGADSLSGLLTLTGASQISFDGGLGPVVGLGSGNLDQLEIVLDTTQLGSVSSVLSFTAEESNASGYQAALGTYNVTIEADIVPAPVIIVPAFDTVQYGTEGLLQGLSITVASSLDSGAEFQVLISAPEGTLGIGTLGNATLSGSGDLLTLTGSLADVNDALASLDYTALTQGSTGSLQTDLITISSNLAGGPTSTNTLLVEVNQPPAFSLPATLSGEAGAPVVLAGLDLADPDGLSANETLRVTLSDLSGTLAATALDGGTVSGPGESITLTGGLAAVQAELASVTYTGAADFTMDTLLLTADDGRGGTASGTVAITPPPPGIGISAGAPLLTLSPSGTTAVIFTIASTESLSGTQLVSWAVEDSGGAGLDGSYFAGGTLPAGSVTLTPGDSATAITIDVTGGLGSLVSSPLDVEITSVSGGGVVTMPQAQSELVNDLPVAGTDAALSFADLSGLGVLSDSGNQWTLDLGLLGGGTVGTGVTLGPITLAATNAGPQGADTLTSGVAIGAEPAFSFSGLGEELSALAPGDSSFFTLSFDATTAGLFSELIVFTPTEENITGGGGALAPVTLDVVAEVPCFAAGTRIRTARGAVPVERLAVGERVRTLNGPARKIKWIGHRHYDGRFIAGNHLMLPIRIERHALAPGIPSRDLIVSPGHGIYCDGVLVPAWRLVNGRTITQAAQVDRISYYHVELEAHEIIFAEACPTESFLDEGARDQFQNSAEFYRLYAAPAAAPVALPRVESGFLLDAIQRRLAARAGIARGDLPPGPLRGFVDRATAPLITGWAQDATQPEAPVSLDILADGKRVATVLANLYRADLRAAKLGSGCHAFEIRLPPQISGRVEVRRTGDGEILPLTESAAAAA